LLTALNWRLLLPHYCLVNQTEWDSGATVCGICGVTRDSNTMAVDGYSPAFALAFTANEPKI
jgi:hypothetical protein